jgi:hypothetical protein
MTKTKTFKVDNLWLQRTPTIITAKLNPLQPILPGINLRLPAFDEWASYALYSLLDPENPTAPVYTTPTKLLERLGFARVISSALAGYETFPSDNYQMLEETLHRLYSVEIERFDYWRVRKPGQKRIRKQPVHYRGRFLTSYRLIYPEGVTPADLLPPEERENVNTMKNLLPDGPAIWKAKKGPRPEGIEYRIDPDLVKGLTKDDPNIGTTTMPFKIFDLYHKGFSQSYVSTRVLVWVMRQAKETMTRDIDGLIKELNLDTNHMKYMRNRVVNAFGLLKRERVVEAYLINYEDSAGRGEITFTKSKDWYLTDPEEGLPDLPEGTEDNES